MALAETHYGGGSCAEANGYITRRSLMQSKDAFVLLISWVDEYQKCKKDDLRFLFSDKLSIGTATLSYDFNNDEFQIMIGFAYEKTMSDQDVIRAGVAIFHMFHRYEQLTDKDIPKEILLSSLSEFGNSQYHRDYRYRLPHAIKAEAAGIMTVWSRLKKISDLADRLMLEYVADQAEQSYVFEIPADGLQSKEQVEDLFEKAYQESLTDKRGVFYGLTDPFFGSDDELAQMLADGYVIVSIPYYPLYYQVYMAETGQEIDRMLSSFAAYLHPELQKVYSHLDFSKLDPIFIFGIPMPETKEEIFSRISRQIQKKAEDKTPAVVELSDNDEVALTNPILCPGPTKKPTEDEMEQFELAWKVLCETGSVDVMDPLNTDTRSLKEILSEPGTFIRDYHDSDGVPSMESLRQITSEHCKTAPLRKVILCPESTNEFTKEEEEEFELAWKILCETGSLNVMNPLDTDNRTIEEILQDPNMCIHDYHDWDSEK